MAEARRTPRGFWQAADIAVTLAVIPPLALVALFRESALHVLEACGALVILFWIVLRLRGALVLPRSPFVPPAVLLLSTVIMGTWVSKYPEWSLPKLGGVVIGALLFRLILLYGTTARRLLGLVAAYYATGVAVVFVGVLFLGTFPAKFAGMEWIGHIYAWLARQRPGFELPGTVGGVNPNGLGATTLFYLPGLLALVVAGVRRRGSTDWIGRRWRAAAIAATVVQAAALLLTQSRAAWLGALAAGVLISFHQFGRRGRLVVLTVAVLSLVFIRMWYVTPVTTGGPVVGVAEDTTSERLEFWSRGLQALRDHPWTGVGLNAFRSAIHEYPRMKLTAVGADIAHAHNVFLQTALDGGLIALGAYLWLLAVAARLSLQVMSSGGPLERALALGLLANVAAVHVLGLVESVSLGSKVGVALWLAFGLIGALQRVSEDRAVL